METPKINYAIYPSLLDAYLRFKRHDDDETFDNLFDKINKVKTEQTEQQVRGVEFEGLVNDKIDGKLMTPADDLRYYSSMNFQFKADLIDSIAGKLKNAISRQEYIECILPSHVGNIKLYGIIDFRFPRMITDLKGTENYKCNKYQDNCQHPVYTLIEKVNFRSIDAFKYVVSDYEKRYQETYIPTENMHQKLMITIYEFINFIEYFKSNITDQKIFGHEETKTGPIKTATSLPEVREELEEHKNGRSDS